MNKFLHTKSNFPKHLWDYYAREGLYSCAPIYCGFSTQGQMAPQQTANFRTAFLVIFYVLVSGAAELSFISTYTL